MFAWTNLSVSLSVLFAYLAGIFIGYIIANANWVNHMAKSKKKVLAPTFPLIKQLGFELKQHGNDGFYYVERTHLKEKIAELGIKKKFHEYFGIQTQFTEGPYAHDVEAVLQRIYNGKLQGSQLNWD